jgi:glycopeptide antibiotics resistance protein
MILKLLSDKWFFTIYLLAILLIVTLPLNTASELNNITILQLRGDYFFHILLFLPWVFFSGVFNMKKIYWVLIGLLFAAGSEALQYLLPYRAYNVNDLLANMLGVCFSFPLTLLFNHSGKL